jgi:hypothetical protein
MRKIFFRKRGPGVADPCPLSQTLSPNLLYYKEIEALSLDFPEN